MHIKSLMYDLKDKRIATQEAMPQRTKAGIIYPTIQVAVFYFYLLKSLFRNQFYLPVFNSMMFTE